MPSTVYNTLPAYVQWVRRIKTWFEMKFLCCAARFLEFPWFSMCHDAHSATATLTLALTSTLVFFGCLPLIVYLCVCVRHWLALGLCDCILSLSLLLLPLPFTIPCGPSWRRRGRRRERSAQNKKQKLVKNNKRHFQFRFQFPLCVSIKQTRLRGFSFSSTCLLSRLCAWLCVPVRACVRACSCFDIQYESIRFSRYSPPSPQCKRSRSSRGKYF